MFALRRYSHVVLTILLHALVLTSLPAGATILESVLMPGEVIQDHAEFQARCDRCHIPFNKAAQTKRCQNCHKEVARDVAQKEGFHGRMNEQRECRVCHTEHQGRAADIAPINDGTFDHARTDFPLNGAHARPDVKCRSCHKPGDKYREAPSDCYACHKKDDVHKGTLGQACAQCHTERTWKARQFDHDTTRFSLRGAHSKVDCGACHPQRRFKNTPRACYACHKKDDSHKGNFGRRCETCHTEKDWKASTFNHSRDTKFAFKGKHARVKCEKCHKRPVARTTLKGTCISCHRKDDTHKGNFGQTCETCHTDRGWKRVMFNHRRDTEYPLRGQHRSVACESCHKGHLYRDKLPSTCHSCHKKDDPHRGQHRTCEQCHNELSWKKPQFDHDLTRFPILGKHQDLRCKTCHRTKAFQDAPTACVACHHREDAHKRRLGTQCGSCHNPRDWKLWGFDHDRRTRFKLDGGHDGLDCLTCHTSTMKRKVILSASCFSCHRSDDAHDGLFGLHCERCHVSSSFDDIKPGI